MKKIVVATDFSESSVNAFLHALSIAQKTKSDLLLVWVDKPATDKDKFLDKESYTQDVKRQFDEMIAKYQPELATNKISYKIRKGKVYKEIAQEASESRAMLVVAGTHGASGFEEFWAGSNATRIISSCRCPVITIRAGIDVKRPLSKIVLPIDSSPDTRQKSTFTGFLAKEHDAMVCILPLYTSKMKSVKQNVDLYAKQVGLYFDEEEIKYEIEGMYTDNISNSCIEYAKKIDANLISIMTEQESTASNLWMGPYAHQTVNHSPFPVLSIHSKDTLASGSGF